jgi:hypothetical protein
MSNHVNEWLSAYRDGELRGSKLQHVEAHLAECESCQAELESLESLSSVLKEVPTPEFMPVERFATQVNLRLPHKQTNTSRKQLLEIGWWMIPVGLLGAWIFIATSIFVGDILSAANRLGFVSSLSNWFVSDPSNGIYISATLGQAGLLSDGSLHWAESVEAFTRTSLPLLSLQISIALLYLSWIIIWWAHHTRHGHQPNGQLLEG